VLLTQKLARDPHKPSRTPGNSHHGFAEVGSGRDVGRHQTRHGLITVGDEKRDERRKQQASTRNAPQEPATFPKQAEVRKGPSLSRGLAEILLRRLLARHNLAVFRNRDRSFEVRKSGRSFWIWPLHGYPPCFIFSSPSAGARKSVVTIWISSLFHFLQPQRRGQKVSCNDVVTLFLAPGASTGASHFSY